MYFVDECIEWIWVLIVLVVFIGGVGVVGMLVVGVVGLWIMCVVFGLEY